MESGENVRMVDAVDDAVIVMHGAAAALTGREDIPQELAWLVAYVLERCAGYLTQAADTEV